MLQAVERGDRGHDVSIRMPAINADGRWRGAVPAANDPRQVIRNLDVPLIRIIDMRQEFQETGHEQVISRKLAAEIQERIEKKEQVMVLLNRRGYSPVVR